MTTRLGWARPGSAVAIAVIVAFLPWLGVNGYWTRQIILVIILALIVSGLNTSFGYAGELAMNQVAVYAVGAYVSGYLAVSHGIDDIGLCLLASIVAVVVVGLITGIPGLSLTGWTLAMLTFFLVLILPNVLDLLSNETGGVEGLVGIPEPTFAGIELSGSSFYVFVVIVASLWFAVLRNIILSPHGQAFLVLKRSPILASAMGISVRRLKLLAYVLGAIPAGIAGVFFAFLSQYISPVSFSLTFAFAVLTASIVGGPESIYGAIFGAAIVQLGSDSVSSLQDWSLVAYGVFLVLAGVFFTDGLVGLLRIVSRRYLPERLRPWVSAPSPVAELPAAAAAAELPRLDGRRLEVERAYKVFGGLNALTDVTIDAAPGEVTAIIGPNGSGKTTLLNLINGFYPPSAGEVLLDGRRIDRLGAFRTARAGVARTFQTPMVPKGISTLSFVATGAYISQRVSVASAILRLRRFRHRVKDNNREAKAILDMLGIGDQAGAAVNALPLGTRRLAEVGRCLMARPRVFLFDEVGSGLDEADLSRLQAAIDLIRRAGGTVILVEHNLPLVLRLADRIHVLSKGVLLASGSPAEIVSNPQVLEEYTGRRLDDTTVTEGDAARVPDSSSDFGA